MSKSGATRRQVLAGSLAAVAVPALGSVRPPIVDAPAGRMLGERLGSGVTRFLGLRYGRAERFAAPSAEMRLPGVTRATAFAPVAMQRSKRGPQSEDCLFLNIWSPAAEPGAALPVMVYIHGGAYAFGSGTDPINDGERLAERGVVVVTVNHRLNAFGYLYLARLDPRFPDSGNTGQLDLVLALRWVRDNIAAFGGDPRRITTFGDSGGGAKITTLLAMSSASGLIHRAATMSGQQVMASGPIAATRRARAVLIKLGIAERDSGQLLTLAPERLLEGVDAVDPILGGPVYFGPVVDQRSLRRHPFWPDAHPLSLAVPMMAGNARDEMRAFSDPDGAFVRSMSWNNVGERIADELPTDILPEKIVAEYRRHLPSASAADVYFAATTAGRSWRPQLEVAEARARAGRPAWVYQVDFTSRAEPRRGAFHCIDVPLVFGTFDKPGADIGEDAAVSLMSRVIQDCFVAFAATGQPALTGAAEWPIYDLCHRSTMIFDSNTRVEQDPRRWQRRLFADAPYRQPGS